MNMEFNHEQYENHYAGQSTTNNFSNDESWLVCGLCGVMGKLFIKVVENQELNSNIKKYMTFIDVKFYKI